jgi:hypothetical protein
MGHIEFLVSIFKIRIRKSTEQRLVAFLANMPRAVFTVLIFGDDSEGLPYSAFLKNVYSPEILPRKLPISVLSHNKSKEQIQVERGSTSQTLDYKGFYVTDKSLIRSLSVLELDPANDNDTEKSG